MNTYGGKIIFKKIKNYLKVCMVGANHPNYPLSSLNWCYPLYQCYLISKCVNQQLILKINGVINIIT
jgi:hypothetical protein